MAEIEPLLERLSRDLRQSGLAHSSKGLVRRASRLAPTKRPDATWSLSSMMGRAVLLTGPARLSATMLLSYQAQKMGTIPLWIAATNSLFFPADAARMGIDLSALPVVHLDSPAPRLLWRLVRRAVGSEAFPLVVVDGAYPTGALATQLARAAAEHRTALVVLPPPSTTGKPDQENRPGKSGSPRQMARFPTRIRRRDAATFLATIDLPFGHQSRPGTQGAVALGLESLPELTLIR